MNGEWRKSSFSGQAGTCVEVRHEPGFVLVRDSKDPLGAILAFSRPEWDAFVRGVREGELG